jgi:hypothetical protein
MYQLPALLDGVNSPLNEVYACPLLSKRPGCSLFVPESDDNPFEYRAKDPITSDGPQTSHEPPNLLDKALGGGPDEYKMSVIPSNPMARIGVLSFDPLPSPQITSSNQPDATRTRRSSVVHFSRHPHQKAHNDGIVGGWRTLVQLNVMCSVSTMLQAVQENADHASSPNTTIVTTYPECEDLNLTMLSDLDEACRLYSLHLQWRQLEERVILEDDSYSAHGGFSDVWKGLWKDTVNCKVRLEFIFITAIYVWH